MKVGRRGRKGHCRGVVTENRVSEVNINSCLRLVENELNCAIGNQVVLGETSTLMINSKHDVRNSHANEQN